MQFAINYSAEAAKLRQAGRIQVDCFKCPAWPTLIAAVHEQHPIYVHFPLIVGAGLGDAINTETNQPADWGFIEHLLTQTNTPFVNLHLKPRPKDYPDIGVDTTAPDHIELLSERLIRDIMAVANRFGRERVIVENDFDDAGETLLPAFLPDVISHIVRETGCGFLFDASHARLAAQYLGWDIVEYITTLPLNHAAEIHLTGLQTVDARWVAILQKAGAAAGSLIRRYAGRQLDHLPMTEQDWPFVAWLVEQIRSGVCCRPWVISLEYGGVGPLWETITGEAEILAQAPRLHHLIQELGLAA
jgi:uncharacterized protein (UPF0276 family)